jgi:hypothetical protein
LPPRTAGSIHGFRSDVRYAAEGEQCVARIWGDGPLTSGSTTPPETSWRARKSCPSVQWQAVIGIVLMGTINMTRAARITAAAVASLLAARLLRLSEAYCSNAHSLLLSIPSCRFGRTGGRFRQSGFCSSVPYSVIYDGIQQLVRIL